MILQFMKVKYSNNMSSQFQKLNLLINSENKSHSEIKLKAFKTIESTMLLQLMTLFC